MSTALKRSVADASLSDVERRVVQGLIDRLREELGADLLAVWLYGSRARGEADPQETDPDRRSDIDLMIIVDPSRRWSPFGAEAIPLLNEVAEAESDSPVYYSIIVYDTARLRDRRDIRSFFIQEVDRDKIVLAGSALDETPDERSSRQ